MRHFLTADIVVTMGAGPAVIEDGGILVEGGRIAAIGLAADLRAGAAGAQHRHFANHLLMPGLINTHCHSGLLRGTAEGLPVWEWLETYINPMHKVLSAGEAEAASWLAYAESVLGGTTTIVDMWRFMDGSAKAATTIGNRLVMVPYVGAHPDHSYFDTLDDNERLIEAWHSRKCGRIEAWVGLEHLLYTDAAGRRRAAEMAQHYNTGLHTHIAEAAGETEACTDMFGLRPVAALAEFGLLESAKTLLAHCVWLDDADIATLRVKNVAVAHNPISNMKLASGAARITDLRAAGVTVGLGTDGEKENNNFDMFEEMKAASLLAKLRSMDATALDSWDVLRMATIDGARAIGLGDQIGSLEPGKKADIIAVRTDTPRMTPLFPAGRHANIHHNLVHAVRGSDVAMVMVDGEVIVEEGTLITASLPEIIEDARKAARSLFHKL